MERLVANHKKTEKKGLSGGAFARIVISVVAAVVVILIIIISNIGPNGIVLLQKVMGTL